MFVYCTVLVNCTVIVHCAVFVYCPVCVWGESVQKAQEPTDQGKRKLDFLQRPNGRRTRGAKDRSGGWRGGVTYPRRAEEEEDEGVLFIVPAILLPPDGCGETKGCERDREGERERARERERNREREGEREREREKTRERERGKERGREERGRGGRERKERVI